MERQNFGIKFALAAMMLTMGGLAQAGVIIYVNVNANANANGSTWELAYTDLQDALTAATSGDQIWVAAGQYRPDPDLNVNANENRSATYTLKDGVEMYGGFDGTETLLSQRNPGFGAGFNDTRLVGSYDLPSDPCHGQTFPYRRYHIVTGQGVGTATRLDGFTFENAKAEPGDDDPEGGGVRLLNSRPLIANCFFWHNRAVKGGAIYFDPGASVGATQEVVNCRFVDNLGNDNEGGAYFNKGGKVSFTNCEFAGNKAGGDGAAIHNDNGTTIFRNCTFAGNVSNGKGGGIFSTGANDTVTVTNSIFWDNLGSGRVREQQIYAVGTNLTVDYSCVEDILDDDNVYSGTGNIDANPNLIGPSAAWCNPTSDARVTAGSPVIDAANNDELPIDVADLDGDGDDCETLQSDLDLNPRRINDPDTTDTGAPALDNPYTDMGAYEFIPSCTDNDDCEDGDPCTVDACESSVCAFSARLYGDANNDGALNIVDVVCVARVIFQEETICGGWLFALDEIDIAPSAVCGDGLLNIVDVVVHARAVFQNAVDECCDSSCTEGAGGGGGGAPEGGGSLDILLEASDTTPDAGADVVITAWLENNLGSSVEISAYQTGLDCSAAGGSAGSIEARTNAGGQACTGYEQETTCAFMCAGAEVCVVGTLDCDPGVDCLDPVTGAVLSSGAGFCEDTGLCLTLPGVDQTHSDYMLSCASGAISVSDHSCTGDADIIVTSFDINGSCTLTDTQKKYLGTFIYHVSNDAEGVFTLDPLTTSVAVDGDGLALTVTLTGVTLTIP